MNKPVTAILILAGVGLAGFFAYKAVEASQTSKLIESAGRRTQGEQVGGALETLWNFGSGLAGDWFGDD